MGRKLRLLRRVRSTLLSVKEKSSDRIIADCRMIEPLVNDKGVGVNNNGKTRKRSLSQSSQLQNKRTCTRNK